MTNTPILSVPVRGCNKRTYILEVDKTRLNTFTLNYELKLETPFQIKQIMSNIQFFYTHIKVTQQKRYRMC